ncbi:hypothetical protein HMPREF3226_01812 [Prevotella corporis]|uniref:Uncharacterized protein n=1 Tax=Prevotella corporis TaxID=28128 RepID=A0A133Q1Y1_9BACT|nr:hypothetical protein HMPREF3226_01812 [Prevotella corporis]
MLLSRPSLLVARKHAYKWMKEIHSKPVLNIKEEELIKILPSNNKYLLL